MYLPCRSAVRNFALLVISWSCIAKLGFGQPASAPAPVLAPTRLPVHPPSPALAPASAFPLASYLTNVRVSNPAVEWNFAIQWVLSNSNATNLAPRVFALTHLAIWQALQANNASRTPAKPVPVAAYAAMLTLKDLLPLYFERYNVLFQQQTYGYSASELDAALGTAGPIVVEVLSKRLDDGFQLPTTNGPLTGPPGEFRDTGAARNQPVEQYSLTEPLLLPANLSSLDWFADCEPPPGIPSTTYNIQYTSVSLYGSANSTVRSPDQTTAAMFWADSGEGTSSIIGQWNRLLLNTIPASSSLARTAQLLAAYNVGLYDCTVALYTLKYKFNFWRPVTAIRAGDPSHPPQADWTPLLMNPNTPTYPSVAAAYAGFAETALNRFYGRDAVTFVASTENKGPGGMLLPNRIYQSFAQAASDVVQSRYFGGSEFQVDSTTGRILGNEVAQYVVDNFDELGS